MTYRLSPVYLDILVQLHEAGGSGEYDNHHRILIGTPKRPLAGQPGQWMELVARGLVAGEYGKVILTDDGRTMAQRELDGRKETVSGGV